MRVKPYTARTTAAAMDTVRAELGDQAIIVSINDDTESGSATVLVATDAPDFTPQEAASIKEVERPDALDTAETIRQALSFHGVPPRLSERLIKLAETREAENPTLALAGALDTVFEFSPLPKNTPLMFVGIPGAGKTITVAKLCTQAKINGHDFRAATTDRRRAGGIEQLSAFTRILGTDLSTLNSMEALSEFMATPNATQTAYIDTQGVNPYVNEDVDFLGELVRTGNAEPVLVLPAGYDPMEAAEMARPFAEIGVKHVVVTRLDVARRTGGILGAAYSAGLAFAEVSLSPSVAERLTLINPVALARIIMPHTDDTDGDTDTETPNPEADI